MLKQEPIYLPLRCKQVLEMIVAGCTNKEMAAQLGITENTVKHHVTHVYEIIGVNSRYFARIRAKELGIG